MGECSVFLHVTSLSLLLTGFSQKIIKTHNLTMASQQQPTNGNLDTALLETIFYNEMMQLDESSPSTLSQELLAYQEENPTTTAASQDPSTIAERDLLSDFGVSSTAAATAPPIPAAASVPAPVPVVVAAAPPVPSAPVPAPAAPAPAAATAVSKERAARLVNQFASLATHLGISLPSHVLTSLTETAALNEERKRTASVVPAPVAAAAAVPQQPIPVRAAAAAPPPVSMSNNHINHTTATAAATTTSATATSLDPVQQLDETAQAAIRAVAENDHKRDATKPALYSKRRKKPRLQDCKAKLAQLREENNMLHHHLANIKNKSSQFEAERKAMELRLRQMIESGVDAKELNPVLQQYTEMYSDYGRHRNQELLFHLQQLEKLAAPTNFTKMGLWSLGQSEGFYTNPKQNPIAGILRKELAITPQQGRKILEQRQRIQQVCNNLRECLALLEKLKGFCQHKQKVFHDRMSKCQEILTPPQVAKLLLWVDEHSQLLESVCPGWGSERIRVKPATSSSSPSSSANSGNEGT